MSVAGVSGAQRYKLEGDGEDDGTLPYLAIYHIDSPEIPYSEEWKARSNTEGWMGVRPHITAVRRGVFRAI